MATLSDWDFFNRNVQSGLLEGRYMNAAFTLVAAGPPRLAAVAGATGSDIDLAADPLDLAYPIGVLQSINLGVNSQIMRLWEIGSERSYFVRGRTVGQVALGRIMYHGPSLLKVLYAYMDSGFGTARRLVMRTSGGTWPRTCSASPSACSSICVTRTRTPSVPSTSSTA
jgi:hypothetical protein